MCAFVWAQTGVVDRYQGCPKGWGWKKEGKMVSGSRRQLGTKSPPTWSRQSFGQTQTNILGSHLESEIGSWVQVGAGLCRLFTGGWINQRSVHSGEEHWLGGREQRPMVLKEGPIDQQHPRHPETCYKYKFLGPIPDLLSQKLGGSLN